jgi:hypothetical protein
VLLCFIYVGFNGDVRDKDFGGSDITDSISCNFLQGNPKLVKKLKLIKLEVSSLGISLHCNRYQAPQENQGCTP